MTRPLAVVLLVLGVALCAVKVWRGAGPQALRPGSDAVSRPPYLSLDVEDPNTFTSVVYYRDRLNQVGNMLRDEVLAAAGEADAHGMGTFSVIIQGSRYTIAVARPGVAK